MARVIKPGPPDWDAQSAPWVGTYECQGCGAIVELDMQDVRPSVREGCVGVSYGLRHLWMGGAGHLPNTPCCDSHAKLIDADVNEVG